MTPVEIIALIIIALGVVKIIFLLVKPHAWFSGTKKLWGNSFFFTIFALILGGISLKYLLEEMTIVQIFAVFGFFVPFMWIALTPYRQDLIEMAEKRLGDSGVFKRNPLVMIIWLALVVWVLMEIF